MKIKASGPITSWQTDGETTETVTDFISLGSKITADRDCSHEIKRRLLLGRIAMTGMGEFNSDDRYIYYCGQESLRRNGVALILNARVRNAVLWCSLKNDRMISVRFQGKPFSITVIQVYDPTSNAKEAEVEDLLELTPRKDVLFIIGDWNAKTGSQGVTGMFGLGVQNEAGQRLTQFCQEDILVIANTLFQKHKRRLYT